MLPTVMTTAPTRATVPICVSKSTPVIAPNICIHGYSGDLNSGSYSVLPSRKATTVLLTSPNTRIWNALASLAMSRIGTNAISTNSTAPVSVMEVTGVPNRSLTFERDGGASLSRLIANGYRDEERMPALAVETSARMAARMTMTTPI